MSDSFIEGQLESVLAYMKTGEIPEIPAPLSEEVMIVPIAKPYDWESDLG